MQQLCKLAGGLPSQLTCLMPTSSNTANPDTGLPDLEEDSIEQHCVEASMLHCSGRLEQTACPVMIVAQHMQICRMLDALYTP